MIDDSINLFKKIKEFAKNVVCFVFPNIQNMHMKDQEHSLFCKMYVNFVSTIEKSCAMYLELLFSSQHTKCI